MQYRRLGVSSIVPEFFEGTTALTFKTLATAACIALSSATASFAAPINLDFTLGVASGTFYDLYVDCDLCPATSFDLMTPLASWTGVSLSGASINEFSFSAGTLTSYQIEYLGLSIPSDDTSSVLRSFRTIDNGFLIPDFLDVETDTLLAEYGPFTYSISPLTPVPLPAGGLLLLSGLAGVAALKRRKKRAA